jgi:hypothetical protein
MTGKKEPHVDSDGNTTNDWNQNSSWRFTPLPVSDLQSSRPIFVPHSGPRASTVKKLHTFIYEIHLFSQHLWWVGLCNGNATSSVKLETNFYLLYRWIHDCDFKTWIVKVTPSLYMTKQTPRAPWYWGPHDFHRIGTWSRHGFQPHPPTEDPWYAFLLRAELASRL